MCDKKLLMYVIDAKHVAKIGKYHAKAEVLSFNALSKFVSGQKFAKKTTKLHNYWRK
jgi:hypothetical protein